MELDTLVVTEKQNCYLHEIKKLIIHSQGTCNTLNLQQILCLTRETKEKQQYHISDNKQVKIS